MKKDKTMSFKEVLAKTYKIVSLYKNDYIIIIMFCLLAALFSSIAPYFLGFATDSLYNSITNGLSFDYTYIVKVLLIVLFCHVVDAGSTYYKSYLSSRLGQKIGYDLRTKLIDKLNKIKIMKIDSMKKGDIISKITNDVERLTDNLTQVIPELIYNISLIIAVIIMMFVLDISLALLTVIIIPITYIILSIIVSKTQKYFELNQSAIGNVNSFVEESVTNNDVIKSFNKEKYFNNKFDRESKKLAEYGYKSSFYSSIAVPLNKSLGNFNYIIIVCLGAFKVISGGMRLGAIQSFIQYLKDFNRPMNVIAQVISNLQMAIASLDRVNTVLDLEEENNGTLTKYDFKDKIEFKNINFSYKEGKQVLKDFNLTINKGEKIALVGKTGTGKTTIVNLFMNFYDGYTGEILIDGVNIKDIDKNEYRKKISMVLQDTWLFEDTIRNNIVFDDEISDSNLSKILDKAKLLHMINGLPNGLNFEINEETNNISAGEKQLLTIARALIANPEILVLDEATSNVDTRLEYLINKSMNNLMEERTSIVIAHRLSTIVNSDKIVVIRHGSVLESGSHKELMDKKGYYYTLYNSQFEVSEALEN